MNNKVETCKNFYMTTKKCSDGNHVEESYELIDKLLLSNGFLNPRKYLNQNRSQERSTTYSHNFNNSKCNNNSDVKNVSLTLPYISESISNNIRRYIRSHNLPIHVIFTPGKKLRDIFCCSRPYDKSTCINSKCSICPNLSNNNDCATTGVVYMVTCNLCGEEYVGETCRSCHERLMEHVRYASSPSTYPKEAMAIHYKEYHDGMTPKLTFDILDRERSTVKRKVIEAFHIISRKPKINNKSELSALERYLV